MAITVTALGASDADIDTLEITSLTIAAGSSIVMGVTIPAAYATEYGGGGLGNVYYHNGTSSYSMTKDTYASSGSSGLTYLYHLDNVAASSGSGKVGATWTGGLGGSHDLAIAAYAITGLATSSLDKLAGATGTSTTPSSGATATTTQNDEVVIGVISAKLTATPNGTWNGTTTDNSQGSGGTADYNIHSATKILTTTGTPTSSKTGMTSSRWTAVIGTFKAAAAATGNPWHFYAQQ